LFDSAQWISYLLSLKLDRTWHDEIATRQRHTSDELATHRSTMPKLLRWPHQPSTAAQGWLPCVSFGESICAIRKREHPATARLRPSRHRTQKQNQKFRPGPQIHRPIQRELMLASGYYRREHPCPGNYQVISRNSVLVGRSWRRRLLTWYLLPFETIE
jgi:hypothetical protein